jgi:FKBP-type peptidyl-prolyl cis-trans isomerase (trigger factor)
VNISFSNKDAVSGTLKVEIEKADYAEQIDKKIRNLRQMVLIPGFRKGMAPLGMVKKLYGRQVLTEEMEKIIPESVSKFVQENNINILGQAMPEGDGQKDMDFDSQEDFVFCYEVALAPEINLSLSKSDKLPYYRLIVTDEMVEAQVERYRRSYGASDDAGEADKEDVSKGTELESEIPNKAADLTQDLFDKVFGEGVVAGEADFYAKVKELLEKRFSIDSDTRLLTDMRPFLLEKAGDISFADNILKRWFLWKEENKTKEQIEEEYPEMKKNLKYHLIKEHIVEKNNIQIEDAEMVAFARRFAQQQYASYGLFFTSDEALDNYAKKLLTDESTLQLITNCVTETKIAGWLKEKVELDVKELPEEEFRKIFSADK